MKYYRCSYDWPNSHKYTGSQIVDSVFPLPTEPVRAVNDTRLQSVCLNYGNPIGELWPCPKVIYNVGTYRSKGKLLEQTPSDFLHNDYGWLLTSDKFVQATEEYIRNAVEYLDVNMYLEGTQVRVSGYRILNIIDRLEAFDMVKSSYLVYRGKDSEGVNKEIILPRRYVLLGDVIENHHFFTLTVKNSDFFVSEVIKKIITKNKFTGFRFQEVEVS